MPMIDKQLIAETLNELLPTDAEVDFDFSQNDFVARFCWLLNNDPQRPFKRSKTVEFIVAQKALDDFMSVGNKNEARLHINLEAYINHKLEEFNPDHNSPEGCAEPVEKWLIDSALFLESMNKAGIKKRLF